MIPWSVIVSVEDVSETIKAAGPVVLRGRTLPPKAIAVVDALAPALLAGLIIVELAGYQWRQVDWTVIPGLACAGALQFVKAPVLISILSAVIITSAVRGIPGA